MRVVIRADASATIGSGHVMRTLTLARSLAAQGAEVAFVSRARPGDFRDRVTASGFPVHVLPPTETDDPTGPHGWWGVPWDLDAAETRAAVGARELEWLVVDHYGADERWEHAVRSCARHLMVIDDLADRPHDCDVLLDQNLVDDGESRYVGKVPPRCRVLLGPEYALMQPAYVEHRRHARVREGPVRRILVFYGGADAADLTGKTVDAFLELGASAVHLDVVLPGSASRGNALRAAAASHPSVHLHEQQPTLAPLMAEADLAFGGCGTTTWERLCLGLPSVVVTLAENQRPAAAALHRRALVRWLGDVGEVNRPMLSRALAQELARGCDSAMSRRAMETVDGEGTERVRAVLLDTPPEPLLVREARASDEALLLRWANDPVTRQNAFHPEVIMPDTHRAWFLKRLGAATCRFFIVETPDAEPVGQVRFDAIPGGWEISYSIAAAFRGRGLGKRVLGLALATLSATERGTTVIGRVKEGNLPSRRVFEGLEFRQRPGRDDQAAVVFERAL